MASLRKKGKHFYGRFYDSHRSPSRKEVPLRTTRQDVARRKLLKLEKQFELGKFDPWAPHGVTEPVTVPEGIGRFIDAKSHLRPATVRTYREILERWERMLPPGLRLLDVHPQHIRPFYLDGDISRASQRKRFRHLRVFFNWSADAALIKRSPMDDLQQPKEERKQAAFLTPDELERLLTCIDVHQGTVRRVAGEVPDVQWLKDAICLAVSTGLRRGELLRLRWNDVDLDSRLLTVRSRAGGATKSGHERTIPLAGDALDVLERYKAEGTGMLDGPVLLDRRGLPIKDERLTRRFKFFVRKAKLRDRERLHFHSLRHTCASWLAMKGVPMPVIKEILGHSTIAVTERYSHLAPDVMVKAMESTFGT